MRAVTRSARRAPLTLLALLLACATQAHAAEPKPREHLIHLPGIAGELRVDRGFVRGLRDGGYAGAVEIYDWTEGNSGLASLFARARNERQAEVVAHMIRRIVEDDPDAKVRLVGHSGGTGIAAWALERLPEHVKVESLVLIAPALSQRYDLSKALSRVRGKAYAFTSPYDAVVLGAGTRLFGTIDGVKEEASGMRGFAMPEAADRAQYAKLVQMPYTAGWLAWGNNGDHIGAMDPEFTAKVMAAIVRDREPPTPPKPPTSGPSTRPGVRVVAPAAERVVPRGGAAPGER